MCAEKPAAHGHGTGTDGRAAPPPEAGADTLIGLIAANPEAQRFYRSLEGAKIQDEGIWIDL